jgi:hypothetical protein
VRSGQSRFGVSSSSLQRSLYWQNCWVGRYRCVQSRFCTNAGGDLFFAGTAIKSNFLINIGYGNPAVIRPREERYAFDEACRIV